MTRAAIIALSLSLCLGLSGCGSLIKVHRLDVQQGNVLTQDMLARVHKGMTPTQVKDVLGDPVLKTFIKNDTLEYVYTWQPGYGKFSEKRSIIYFKRGRMSHIETLTTP
jgi:outer membrane protein assembly factor BamE